MEDRRRNPLPTIIFFLLMFLLLFGNIITVSPILFFGILIVAVALIIFVNLGFRPGRRMPGGIPPEYREKPFRTQEKPFRPPTSFKIGKWIIIPIAFAGIIGFILFQNWWLSVRIFQSMYSVKAGIDWWKINFLDNYYFYACIAIGLLVALSDPRIVISKDEARKRRIYLHSKFWGAIRVFFSQISSYSYGESSFSLKGIADIWDDKISLKRGILWKIGEFLAGTFVIGPSVAQELSFGYLLLTKWIETQQISWIIIIQRSMSTLFTRLFTAEMPTGVWLIDNSPILEFLVWIRTPIIIFGIIWAIRLIISFFFELRSGKIAKSLRAMTILGLIILTPILLEVPTQVFDITTPLYIRSLIIGEIVLIALTIFFSVNEVWVQRVLRTIYLRKIYLIFIVVLVLGSILSGPIIVAVQYAPSIQGNWKDWIWTPTYLPDVEYTRWATGLENIQVSNVTAALDTGENLAILSKVRIFSNTSSQLRLKPRIGVNWMDFPTAPDIILSNEKEYWVAGLTIVLPPSEQDTWRSQRLLITHSERILALDAADGEIIPIESVFNLTDPVLIYYGEAGLFAASPMVYVDTKIAPETHLPNYNPTWPQTYEGNPDYVLTGTDRLWFFSGLYGQESLQLDFATGQHGDIKMLYLRDIKQRLSPILLPDMTIDNDPYIVCDPNGNIYYLEYVYVERNMPSEYLDYPQHNDKFWRSFAVVLTNAYDGSISGYLLGLDENNYVMDFYRSMYPQWNQPIPEWLTSQLRYPEYLYDKQIESYNIYHVSNPDDWQNNNFFELTTDSNGNIIEEVRYVFTSLNEVNYWAGVRLVESYQSPGKNLAGIYVALNQENLGKISLVSSGNIALAGPQTALDTITNYGPTKALLTLNPNWVSGNILMYVIRGKPYYFIPYYARTETTLSPAMVVSVDATSQKVGYYVIQDPTNAPEVGSASAKAYSNLIGTQIESTAEARKNKVINEFVQQGYTLKTPTQLNPNIAFQENSTTFYKDEDWNNTAATISSFINIWVKSNHLSTIFEWESVSGSARSLNFGILLTSSINGVEEHYITIAYSSG